MNNKLILCMVLITIGCVSYLIQNEYMIILFPEKNLITSDNTRSKSIDVLLYTWTPQEHYITEKAALLPEQTPRKILHTLIQTWLNVQEYQKMPAPTLATIALSYDKKDLFLNFSHYPFAKERSTYAKLIWIQGLLKTINAYNQDIEQVYFLVDNKSLQDYELDFSYPWPIIGFLK
jgi:hypothetical protein